MVASTTRRRESGQTLSQAAAAHRSNSLDFFQNVVMVICFLIVVASVSWAGLKWAMGQSHPAIYDSPKNVLLERSISSLGNEIIKIDATLVKLRPCAINSDSGTIRINFYTQDGRTDTAPLFSRVDPLSDTGRAIEEAGSHTIQLFARVPQSISGDIIRFSVEIPCQIAEPSGPRKIVGRWGPLPMPKVMGTLVVKPSPTYQRNEG